MNILLKRQSCCTWFYFVVIKLICNLITIIMAWYQYKVIVVFAAIDITVSNIVGCRCERHDSLYKYSIKFLKYYKNFDEIV